MEQRKITFKLVDGNIMMFLHETEGGNTLITSYDITEDVMPVVDDYLDAKLQIHFDKTTPIVPFR